MMVAALGAVYSTILGEEPRRYVPYLAAGLIIWGFIASTIQQGCEVFIQEASVLWQIYLPKSTCLYRVLWRNLIVLTLNLLVFVAVATWYAIMPRWTMLLTIPAFGILYLNIAWLTLILALVCTRFRDITQLITILLQLLLLVTPILWDAEAGRFFTGLPLEFALSRHRIGAGTVVGPSRTGRGVAGGIDRCHPGLVGHIRNFPRFRQRILYWL